MRPLRFLPCLLALGLLSCQTAAPPYPPNAPVTKDGYKKVVEDQIGPIWYRLVKEKGDYLNVGTVKMTFEIPSEGGRARNLKILSRGGGKLSVAAAINAVRALRAPPIPAVVRSHLGRDGLKIEESFTIFANR